MKKAWVIIGEANTRKSGLVRCLTGIDNIATQVEIQTSLQLSTRIRAFISAAQEAKMAPLEVLNELNSQKHWAGNFKRIRNAIITLRYDAYNKLPAADKYIEALIGDGWVIQAIVSLGEPARDWIVHSGVPFISIPDSTTLPNGVITTKVKQAFGWL